MSTPNVLNTMGKSAEPNHSLNPWEEDKRYWSTQLLIAKQQLSDAKNYEAAQRNYVANIQYDLKMLRTENPASLLKNQQKALELATSSLTAEKNKTVIGTIEMIAISVSTCAIGMTSLRFMAADVFSFLISFKIPAMTFLSSLVGTSGVLGWNADRKAALSKRMAQDDVKASLTAVNQSKIRCEDHKKRFQQKIAEATIAQEEYKKATLAVHSAAEAVRQAELNLNKVNKEMTVQMGKTFSANNNTTFTPASASKEASPFELESVEEALSPISAKRSS